VKEFGARGITLKRKYQQRQKKVRMIENTQTQTLPNIRVLTKLLQEKKTAIIAKLWRAS
jgi:hypothetical protein